MAGSRVLCLVLVVGLLGEAFTVPLIPLRTKRGFGDNELDSAEGGAKDLIQAGSDNRPVREDADSTSAPLDNDESESRSGTTTAKPELATPVFDDDSDDDDDDDFEPINTAPSGGGSNIFSLLRLANAIFPSSSGGANAFIRRVIRRYLNNQLTPNIPILPNYPATFNPTTLFLRRQDVTENKIDIDDIKGLKPPPLQRQETEEDGDHTNESSDESDENNAAESVEDDKEGNGSGNDNGNASKQKSGSEEKASENNSDYSDEPPEGDGQGGGILGLIAGLSGGEDGQSDLGSLLATISGIVANLSGDGFDLNSLIGSGIGLFVGLLSEGAENPGAVVASYLLTSLDTITGGGSQNNGAFFGTFLSKLIRGTSAGGDPDASSEEGKEPEKDSAGFFGSFLMALLGEMSKGSSGGSSSCTHCHPSERLANTQET